MNDEMLTPEHKEALDELMSLLKKMPKEHVTMLNLPRYAQALNSINKIVNYVKGDCPDAEVKVFFDEITGTCLCLEIIADELNIYKIQEFCEAIAPASTFSVTPRLDYMVEIGVTYEEAKLPMKPNA
jgi:beta-lactamase class D